jgi:hypothetical protein
MAHFIAHPTHAFFQPMESIAHSALLAVLCLLFLLETLRERLTVTRKEMSYEIFKSLRCAENLGGYHQPTRDPLRSAEFCQSAKMFSPTALMRIALLLLLGAAYVDALNIPRASPTTWAPGACSMAYVFKPHLQCRAHIYVRS